MGDKSRFNGLAHYVSQGMTEEQAKQKATLDKIGEVTMAGIGGAFSGGIFGGVTNGVNYVTAQSLGQAVKTEGLTPTVLQQALTLPADSQAHQMAQDLTDQLNTSLSELGFDLSGEHLLPRSEQLQKIDQVTDSILSDQAVGELTRLVEQVHLTQAQKSDKVDTQNNLVAEVYPNVLPDGHFSIESAREYAKALETADINSLSQYLGSVGYTTSIAGSSREYSRAKKIQITGGSEVQNISQVQFSPGNGRHGPNPYLKFSTTDQGIIKIVYGDPKTYISDGQEKATIIFVEEMN